MNSEQSNRRSVEAETVNAYRVQKLSDGSVRIKSGGRVVVDDTYYGALERYAVGEKTDVENLPDHLRKDRESSIYDGYIQLDGFASTGFTPLEILDMVTAHPEAVLIDAVTDSLETSE